VKCSQVLYDDIRERGGKAIMWKVGHSLIKAKMREVDAVLAGEMSGHMFSRIGISALMTASMPLAACSRS